VTFFQQDSYFPSDCDNFIKLHRHIYCLQTNY